MRTAVASFLLGVLVLGTATAQAAAQKYTVTFDTTIDGPIYAEVDVKVTGRKSNTVSVKYFSAAFGEYLGQFQASNVLPVPSNGGEARDFAISHYRERL